MSFIYFICFKFWSTVLFWYLSLATRPHVYKYPKKYLQFFPIFRPNICISDGWKWDIFLPNPWSEAKYIYSIYPPFINYKRYTNPPFLLISFKYIYIYTDIEGVSNKAQNPFPSIKTPKSYLQSTAKKIIKNWYLYRYIIYTSQTEIWSSTSRR